MQDDDGKFVQVTPKIARTVAELVLESRRFNMLQRVNAITQREKKIDRQWNNDADAMLEIAKPDEVLPWRARDEEIKEWSYAKK